MANPKSAEARQAFIDENPFDGFKISDNSILNELEGRHPCPNCGKSRKFFCYTCYVPIAELAEKLPRIKLPIKVDIIKHKHEIDGKSTAGHAAVLSPDDVKIYTYPDIPNYSDEGIVLLYPSYKARTIGEVFTKNYDELYNENTEIMREMEDGTNHCTLLKKLHNSNRASDGSCQQFRDLPISKAVFIDSTWNQSKGIYKDDRINHLPCVVLQNRVSQFWRHQKGSPRWYLATIEAVHQFLVEIHLNAWGIHPDYEGLKNCFSEIFINDMQNSAGYKDSVCGYNGHYDNLLFFFQHMYTLIHSYYEHEQLQAYKRELF